MRKKEKTDFESVIGVEVHVQLSTKSKLFCSCSTRFGAPPNSQTCPVCLGMPGALPKLNKQAVDYALRLAWAVNGKVHRHSQMARKNYFYPDLPKGYQISQADLPICTEGELEIEVQGKQKKIRIQRIHLEEDAGKSVHNEDYVRDSETLIDLNRCGVPLVEIVTEPDFANGDEVAVFLTAVRQLVRYLQISEAHMEQGSLRCDANISVRLKDDLSLGTRTELKNLNSIRHVRKALNFERERQIQVLNSGGVVFQETRLWDEKNNQTRVMRNKELAHDYRYFPEPDLPPLRVELKHLYEIIHTQPELPRERRKRFIKEYKLEPPMAAQLTESATLANYFESTVQNDANASLSAYWILGELTALMHEQNLSIDEVPVSSKALSELLKLISDEAVSAKGAKTILRHMWDTKHSAAKLLDKLNLRQESDEQEITALTGRILKKYAPQVKAYQEGKVNLLGFFVGQVMQASGGRANPRLVHQIIKQELDHV